MHSSVIRQETGSSREASFIKVRIFQRDFFPILWFEADFFFHVIDIDKPVFLVKLQKY